MNNILKGVGYMKTEVTTNLSPKKRSKLMIILLVFTAVMLVSAGVSAYVILQHDSTYKGVHIGGLDVSGMSREEMLSLLETRYTVPASGLDVTLKTDLAELKASYPDLGSYMTLTPLPDGHFP